MTFVMSGTMGAILNIKTKSIIKVAHWMINMNHRRHMFQETDLVRCDIPSKLRRGCMFFLFLRNKRYTVTLTTKTTF